MKVADLIEYVVAFSGALLAATVLILVVLFIIVMLAASRFTGEGATWFPITIGMPAAALSAVFVFAYTFSKIKHYGDPQ